MSTRSPLKWVGGKSASAQRIIAADCAHLPGVPVTVTVTASLMLRPPQRMQVVASSQLPHQQPRSN